MTARICEAQRDNSEVQRFGLDLSDADWVNYVRSALRPAPTFHIGRFEILSEIQRGGQGIVYRARDTTSQRIVALKRLVTGSLASERERFRFEREVEAARKLDHPNIVRVLDFEIVNNQPLIAMEWVDGLPISRWAQKQLAASPDSLPIVLEIYMWVCEAVHHAHQRGVIHRDLKPGNILVTEECKASDSCQFSKCDEAAERKSLERHESSGPLSEPRVAPLHSRRVVSPRIIDFGVAKLVQPGSSDIGITGSRDFLGTPAYAAPEQVDGRHEAVDVRTDVYALGVVLYEILTGRRPFESDLGPARLFDAIRAGDFAPPSRTASWLRGDLDAIVLKAMAREPQHRYQSAEALAEDIRRFLSLEPLAARRGQRGYALRKWLRKYRLAASLGGMALGMVGFAAVGFSILYAQQKHATAAMTTARDAESAARQEIQRSQSAMSRLLLNMAEAGRGTDLILRRSLLIDAERATEADLRESPAALASARDAIGRTYQALGLYDESYRLLNAALELRTTILGRNHPDTATSLRNLGSLCQDASKYVEAEAHLSEAARIHYELFGENHPSAAQSLHDQGIIASNRGDFRSALDSFRKAAELRARLLGSDHSDTLESLEAVAYAHANLGEFALAVTQMQALLEQTLSAFGAEHRGTAGLHVGLGKFLAEQNELAAAEAHLRHGLELFRRLLGNRHDNVAWAAHRLGNLLHKCGQDDEAEALLLEAREIYERVLGPEDRFVGFVRESLERFYEEAGRRQRLPEMSTGNE